MKIRKISFLLYILLNIHLVLSDNNKEEKILSRHRRYLIFPAGSSLQLVYDLGIPFMEFTAIGVVGVTGAMAWELPSEPVYIDQDLQEAYSKGGLPLLDRNDNDLTENNINGTNNGVNNVGTVSTDKISNKIDNIAEYSYYGNENKDTTKWNGNIVNKQTKIPLTVTQYQRPMVDNYYTNHFPDRYYKSTKNINNKFTEYYMPPQQRQPSQQHQSQLYPPQRQTTNSLDQISNKIDYYFSYVDKLFSTITDMTNRNYNKWNPQKLTPMTANNRVVNVRGPSVSSPAASSYYNQQKQPFRKSSYRRNFIHPVFGRSISDDYTTTTKAKSSIPNEHLKFYNIHRTTRHTLYKKVAALMNMRNLNGMECVLRALCETGQNTNDLEPAPFLLEILRAIFSLPPQSPDDKTSSKPHPVHKMYDTAYFSKKNCAEVHKKCAGSIWGPEFQF